MAPEDNPMDEVQPTKEEYEAAATDQVNDVSFPLSEHERRRQMFDAIEAELMQAFNRQDGAVLVVLMRKMRELLT